jgi:hypothetical protein
MTYNNSSLDFLNMIKQAKDRTITPKEIRKTIAVIDTETNWNNEVMSIGVAIADAENFKCVDTRYYILDPEYRVGGMYSSVLGAARNISKNILSRREALNDLCSFLKTNKTNSLYAYNAKFDYGHLPELSCFSWYDIMRLAAYKQYNSHIPEHLPVCKSGRLKSGYSVENILQMLSGNYSYRETHNAVYDAMDELKIMELLGHGTDAYDIARL